MRIAQVAPLYESVPPKLYGGTERVVSWLTEELVREGNDVTLFASADSRTLAYLEPLVPQGLRLDPGCRDPLAHHMIAVDRVAARAHRFDVIHFHTDYLHFPVSRLLSVPHLTTLHGRLDLPDLQPLFRHFCDVPLVSISNNQRAPLPMANWQATVHHGLPPEHFAFGAGDGGYLAFLGRISPEKRPDRAIAIAIATGMPLKIAAKVDPVDREYFEARIRPLLRHPLVEFIGEIGDSDKAEFLGKAAALLFLIDWPEPFGLVMIEAMACGTPVIGWRCGAVPEVVEEGKTGFIVDSIESAAAAVARLGEFDRAACLQAFEARFCARRMARDYLAVYQAVIDRMDATAVAI